MNLSTAVPGALLKWAPYAIYAILGIIFVAGLIDVYVPDTGPRIFVRDGAACFPGYDGGKACIAKLQEYEDAGQEWGVNRMIRANVAFFVEKGTEVEAIAGRAGAVVIEYEGRKYITLDRYLD
jgi:hypothetical protein